MVPALHAMPALQDHDLTAANAWLSTMTLNTADDMPVPPKRQLFRKTLLAAAATAILLAGCASPYHPQGWESTSSPKPMAATQAGHKSGKKELSAKRKASGTHSDAETPRASGRAQANTPVGKKRLGEATYYAAYFEGRLTASGEPYDSQAMTAAHKTLPFGTKVKVTALDSGETAVVRINDRGPFVEGRIIDLSRKAAEQLDLVHDGATEVQLQVLE